MTNPFDDATLIVGELKAEHDRLSVEVPRLRELKKGLVADVDGLNKDIVSAQDRRDAILDEVARHTEAYNNWQAVEWAKLEAAKKEFADYMHTAEDDLAQRAEVTKVAAAAVSRDRETLKSHQVKLKTDQEDVAANRRSNIRWAETLSVEDSRLKEAVLALDSREQAALQHETNMAGRHTELQAKEEQAAKQFRASEADRKTARDLLRGAKEKIADMDAREDSLNHLDNALKDRAIKLKNQEAALNDRRSVMASNGTL